MSKLEHLENALNYSYIALIEDKLYRIVVDRQRTLDEWALSSYTWDGNEIEDFGV